MKGGRQSRQKGNRAERAIVRFLQELEFATERVTLSGSAGGSYCGDLTVPVFGVDRVVEVKCRADVLPIKFLIEILKAAEGNREFGPLNCEWRERELDLARKLRCAEDEIRQIDPAAEETSLDDAYSSSLAVAYIAYDHARTGHLGLFHSSWVKPLGNKFIAEHERLARILRCLVTIFVTVHTLLKTLAIVR